MSQSTPRNIVVTLHKGTKTKPPIGWPRHYACIDNAVRKIGERVCNTQPGHVFVLYHAVTGLEIGTVTVKVGGFEARMEWERAYDPARKKTYHPV